MLKINTFFQHNYIPVVPARGGAEVALDLIIRPFSSIELARAVRRRLPAKAVPTPWPPHAPLTYLAELDVNNNEDDGREALIER